MKSVLISIRPKWCELIASGKKTIEVRKTKPKLETPFKVYIYCTDGYVAPHSFLFAKSGKRKVIGEFLCDKVDRIAHCGTCNNDISLKIVDKKLYCKELDYAYLNKCKLSYCNIDEYSNGFDVYGWHISNLVIYDKPKDLDYFRKSIDCHRGKDREKCKGCWDCEITRPPQSWCYVESEVTKC